MSRSFRHPGYLAKRRRESPLQLKLRISEPGDVLEQEADRVAEQIMRMPEPTDQERMHGIQRRPMVQRTAGGGEAGVSAAPPLVHDALSSPGQALDGATKGFFENRLGHDFSKVRIHSDEVAHRSAREVGARAYTVGQDLVFGQGQYRPAHEEGRRLLAHELTHVVQQQSAGSGGDLIQRAPVFPDDSCEKERIRETITEFVDRALELVRNAITAISNPQEIAGPLRRFYSIEPEDTATIFLIRENLVKLEAKLAGPVDTHCETRREMREKGHKSLPRGYAELDEKTRRPTPSSGVFYNRNIFRITGATTHREVINTVLHEYAHLAGVGHGEPVRGAPIDNKWSIKVRGLTTDQAINSAEVLMRFIRAVNR